MEFLALNFISSFDRNNFIIFSDSLSVLQSLKKRNTHNPLIYKVISKYQAISKSKNISFCWIPSLVGIRGNEDADHAAKLSLSLQHSTANIPVHKLLLSHLLINIYFPSNKYRGIKMFIISVTLFSPC